MDVAYNRHSPSSRRSHPSLNHLSLAPLTPKFPIPDPDALPPSPNHHHSTTSYLEPRSTPPTPSILSRTPSHTRLRAPHKSKSTHTLHALTSPVPAPAAVAKSKSSVAIALPGRYSSAPREDSEWLLRAGAVLVSEARESKGQSWLAARSSSTSLVDVGDGDVGEEREGEVADDEFSPVLSRGGSGSRFASARSSRRGSRVGSRVELGMTVGGRTQREVAEGEGDFVEGPDFVDAGEEDEGGCGGEGEVDERELRRLTREKGFGLGGWVDRLIGWSLFRVEDEERVEGHGELDDRATEEESGLEGVNRRQGSDTVVRASVDEGVEVVPPPGDEEGGWQDAAWLLSVASKIIL